MPSRGRNSKMTLEEIRQECIKYECECLTTPEEFKNYKNQNTTLLKFQYKCGHIVDKTWAAMMKNVRRNTHHCCSPRCHIERVFKDNYNKEENLYKCSKCNNWIELNSTNFKPEKYGVGGYRNYCRKCEQLVKVERMNNWTTEEYIELYLLYNAKRRHKERVKDGRIYENDFELTINDILELRKKQENLCVYSKKSLVFHVTGGYDQVSIERIDSSKTYTKNNVILVRWITNSMKNALSMDEFKKEITNIYNTLCV